MRRLLNNLFCWALLLALPVCGCRFGQLGGATAKKSPATAAGHAPAGDCYAAMATQIEYPLEQCGITGHDWAAAPPLSADNMGDIAYWDLSLQEATQLALTHSQVIRDLGGTILQTPSSIQTPYDPAAVETDPRVGVEAALAAFDAEFSTSVFGEKNDRAINNEFFGGGTRILQQDLMVFQSQLRKRAATGSEFFFRHNVDYDANNAPSNIFPSAWNTNFEAEFRHPLLQGGGLEFNRIAGPNRTPGVYNGVLIARVNTDIELARFELAVRNLISDVENAYWDLYFAYRDLDAKVKARDAALDTWRKIHALYKSGRRGGEAEKEAQAREQYYRFQEEVQNALMGRLIDGTRTGSGRSGGAFRAAGGVQANERRLRQLIGLPPADGRLIRPLDEPINAPVYFDWSEVTAESLIRRVELRRSRWEARRQELELLASRNHLLPRLDAIGRYRWRGFGDDLLDPNRDGVDRFDNAYGNLTSGDFQEWQVGLELSVPIGYRRAFAGVRNAELLLSRARAILREQEHRVLHDAADAVAELERTRLVSATAGNRLEAAREQLAAVRAAYDADKAPLDLLLEAQRRLADAESSRFRALTEYAIAVKNVHYSKGTLLDYNSVILEEGAWNRAARADARDLAARRGHSRPLNYASRQAPNVSRGVYEQDLPTPPAIDLPKAEPLPVESAKEPSMVIPATLNVPAEPISDDAPSL